MGPATDKHYKLERRQISGIDTIKTDFYSQDILIIFLQLFLIKITKTPTHSLNYRIQWVNFKSSLPFILVYKIYYYKDLKLCLIKITTHKKVLPSVGCVF